MTANPLTVLRLALPGEPSIREIADKVRCSHAHLAKFESGSVELSDQHLELYAKAVRSTVTEVRKRYLWVVLQRLDAKRAETVAQLKAHGVKDPRSRKLLVKR